MAEKIDYRLKSEIELYNELNQKKKNLEIELGKVSRDMFKIIGKIELLNDLNKGEEK
jgi:Txe/YoeB family toxin of Txe-Axe toxin-antitoxin module